VPPSDEAMKFDIEMELKIGFNTARKHMKIENDRWYYWADKLGLLVWQDFPAAHGGVTKATPDNTRNKADSDQIELEMQRMVTQLYNHPSIVVWITFNENWGQYDTARIVGLFRKWDPTRLIDESSGGNDHHSSDIRDYHSYPDANRWPNEKDRIIVQGEYGGVGLFEKAHAWQQDVSKLFHFATINSTQQWQKWFIDKMATIRANALVGLGGAVYTQITDIDFEDTGILTFDRAFEKFTNISQLKYFSDKFYPSAFIPNIIIASGLKLFY
jgi:beta-galactosidase/beta-glucuronidase